jgi:hypothetical protein
MVKVVGRKMRDDREIGNIPDLPKAATKGKRPDMHIGTLLDIYHVTTVEALKIKFRNENKLKKFNQKFD